MVRNLLRRLPGSLLMSVIEIIGFGSIVYAAFLVWTVLGFAALGVALVIIANGADSGAPS